MKTIDLREAFSASDGAHVLRLEGIERNRWLADGIERIRDDFGVTGAQCIFLRVVSTSPDTVAISLAGSYTLTRCTLGGWLLQPASAFDTTYWAPELPTLRTLDEFGRITTEASANLCDFAICNNEVTISFSAPSSQVFDWAIWRLDGSKHNWPRELTTSTALERQPYFIYASHTSTSCAAEFYRHLIHGHVYAAKWAWPNTRKICDELDAYALYLIASAMEFSTKKMLYGHLRQQIVLSVMSRQDNDGAFRHGEWTDQYESHNRLINGAVKLLASEFERTRDPAAAGALSRAAKYLARQIDQTAAGAWILHDSLELSERGINYYPFVTMPSRWMGKSKSNLLIVNTHMDCMLALRRYREVCDDEQYEELLASAQQALISVLTPQPADWLYKPLMRLIGLTLLPEADQERLPIVMRALKRLTWKCLLPNWHVIRGHFPRFVMPGGYLERSLGQEGFVHRYHGVHLMDFEHYLRKFSAPLIERIADGLVDFGVSSQVTQFWKEDVKSKDTLAFWAEGLFALCLRSRKNRHRKLLADSVIDLTDAGLGLPPSLLGVNAELTSPRTMAACPSPVDPRVRIINLSQGDERQFLAVNTAYEPLPLRFDAIPSCRLTWKLPDSDDAETQIPPRGWVIANSSNIGEFAILESN